jgi:serine/threonine protein kinase
VDSYLTLPIGTVLEESYRIEQVIGSGGFGVTCVAEDLHLGTRVAIKEYCPEEFGTRGVQHAGPSRSERSSGAKVP